MAGHGQEEVSPRFSYPVLVLVYFRFFYFRRRREATGARRHGGISLLLADGYHSHRGLAALLGR